MTSTHAKDWRDWPTPPILEDTVYDSHSNISVLKGLMKGARMGRVGFHAEELDSSARAWAAASKAFPVDSMAWRECREQSAKFAAWYREIKDGQAERATIGIMTLEPKDWPAKETFERAIKALELAGIK